MKKTWPHLPYRILDKSPSFQLLLTHYVFLDPEKCHFPHCKWKELDWFYPALLAARFLALRNDRYCYSLATKTCTKVVSAGNMLTFHSSMLNYLVNDFYFWHKACTVCEDRAAKQTEGWFTLMLTRRDAFLGLQLETACQMRKWMGIQETYHLINFAY